MRIVRVEEISLAAAQTNTYDVEAMGAHGVIVEMTQDEGTGFLLTGISQAGGLTTRVIDMLSGQRTANHEFANFGVPLPFASVSFVWSGAGARQGRLVFVDEPIPPYGRLVVKKGTSVVAAAATNSVLAASGLGVLRRVQLLISTNQEGHANLTGDFRGTSITMASFATVVGVAGGFAQSAEIPGPSNVSLDLVNDDAVNANTFQWCLIGDLG